MLTLKLTTTALEPGGSSPITWIGGIDLVSVLTRGGREWMDKQTAPGGAYQGAIEFASAAPADAVLSLLYVTREGAFCEERSEYVIAQQAWLLGRDGQTIDRVAP